MKRIVEGKRYNTETAIFVARYRNGLGAGDFRNIDEELYITKSGNWFLAGEGGAMTNYAQSCGNNAWCGGSELQPLSPGEAMAWLEAHNKAEEIEQYFSDKVEDA